MTLPGNMVFETRPSPDEMGAVLKQMGLKRAYKPYAEGENGHWKILLHTRRPVKITKGVMSGVEVDTYDPQTVRVWTNQKQKANAVAKANGFKVRLLDFEAELYVPGDRADEFLHGLGARVKKQLSPEALEKLRKVGFRPTL